MTLASAPPVYDHRYISKSWQSVRRRIDNVWLGWVRRRPGGRPHDDWQAVTREGLPVEMQGQRIRTACEGAEFLAGIHDVRRYMPPVCPIRKGHATREPSLESGAAVGDMSSPRPHLQPHPFDRELGGSRLQGASGVSR